VVSWVVDWGRQILHDLQFYTGRAVSYMLLGAVIVVPIWALAYVWRALKG
jgi:sulfite exporter TauE/SafE